VKSTDKFCYDCGTEVKIDSETEIEPETRTEPTRSTKPPNREVNTEREEGINGTLAPTSRKTAVTGGIFGIIIGFLLAWGLLEAGGAGIGFIAGLIGGTVYVWSRATIHHSIASGLYISGIILVFVPLLFYTPIIAGADAETLEGAGEQIGGVLGLFIWTILFAIFAAIIGLVGRAVKKRAPDERTPKEGV
jgi:hypothetical protein